jgi:signal transduction histidine kinase/ActR/RegA family two-component response regulator
MRLADFVLANMEPILSEWESFARGIWPKTPEIAAIDPSKLRDDAETILRTTARDMSAHQTVQEQSDKSKGEGRAGAESLALDEASNRHGLGRADDGFDISAVVAEYRALRASVLRLWIESEPAPDSNDLADLIRFNESMDQSLAESVRSYAARVSRDREALLTSEQAARQEAEDANRSKDIFLATLSHELRTPLNAIVGWINILRVGGHTEEHIGEGLDVIERSTKAQVQLIEDVLDVSRIVSGKMRLDIRNCDLREPINAGVDAVRPTARARNIRLDVQLEPGTVHAFCDPIRFQQIVWNLVSNAIKFSPKGGTVRVALNPEGSGWRLDVSDNGVGIRADQLPYVFDRFRQADSGSRRNFAGLGLGLSIVKHLTELHGGTVEAHSDGEQQGSTFTVRIPVRAVNVDLPRPDSTAEAVSSDESSNDAPTPVRLDGLRVLVVDDEPDARRMLLKVLEAVGAKVIVVGNAQDALDVIASGANGFDVMVSDLAMPGQDGYDLIREIRQRGHDASALPAVALTGFAHIDDARRAISAGFQKHISKPVDVHNLTRILSGLVGKQRDSV